MDMDQLQTRMERLEKQNRLMKIAGGVVLVLLIGMGAVEMTQIQDEVRAKNCSC